MLTVITVTWVHSPTHVCPYTCKHAYIHKNGNKWMVPEAWYQGFPLPLHKHVYRHTPHPHPHKKTKQKLKMCRSDFIPCRRKSMSLNSGGLVLLCSSLPGNLGEFMLSKMKTFQIIVWGCIKLYYCITIKLFYSSSTYNSGLNS